MVNRPTDIEQRERPSDNSNSPSIECSEKEHDSTDASATAARVLRSHIHETSTMRTTSSDSLRDDSTCSNATGISSRESLIKAVYGLEREARLELLNDDAFAGLLQKTLESIITPLLTCLLGEKMPDLEQRIREAQTAEIDDKFNQVQNTQVYLNTVLNQHRLELQSFGEQLVQQVDSIRQAVDLSRTAASEVYLGGFMPSKTISQPGQSFENMAAGFNGC